MKISTPTGATKQTTRYLFLLLQKRVSRCLADFAYGNRFSNSKTAIKFGTLIKKKNTRIEK